MSQSGLSIKCLGATGSPFTILLIAQKTARSQALVHSDHDWVNVSGFASGGERMLASLAVKISFARVLAPNLNMLILGHFVVYIVVSHLMLKND